MKNTKNPISEEMKTEIKYLVSGAADSVEAEPTHRGKKLSYDLDVIVTALKNGKKFVLPSTIARVNAIYDILSKLKAQDKMFNKVSYAPVKGTVVKHTVKSKNNKEYTYTTAQYFLFIEQ
jgi:hypothetical protein